MVKAVSPQHSHLVTCPEMLRGAKDQPVWKPMEVQWVTQINSGPTFPGSSPQPPNNKLVSKNLEVGDNSDQPDAIG